MRPTKYISLVKRNGFLFTRFFLAILGLLIFFLPSIPMRGQSADLAAKSHRGSELMQSGRFEVAVPIYQDLVRAVPNNPSLLMNLDSALYMTGQNRKAIPQFEAALKLLRDGGVDEYGPMKYALSLQMGSRQFYQRPPNSDVTDEQKTKIKQALDQIKQMA